MNLYVSLDELKGTGALNISGTGGDAELLRLLERASRFVDNWCSRHFYIETAVRYFGVSYSDMMRLVVDDLISVTALAVDEDRDDSWSLDLTELTDFFLLPLNGYPKTMVEINDQSTNIGNWTKGRRTVKVTGKWGYEEFTEDTEATVGTGGWTADATSVAVDTGEGTNIRTGDVLLIESEQVHVSAVSVDTLTVSRGHNGTTAATHAQGKAISRMLAPAPIREAVIMLSSRWWKRKDSGFSSLVGNAEIGQYEVFRGMDSDLELLLKPYRRHIAMGVR